MAVKSIRRRTFLKKAGLAASTAITTGLAAGAPAPSAAQSAAGGPAGRAADMVLKNGKIITVDRAFTIAQAIAIAGDRIVAVGSGCRDGGAHRAGDARRRPQGQGPSCPA